jgi:hypothetical protein
MVSLPQPSVLSEEAPLTDWNNADHPRQELRCRLQLPAGAVCGESTRLWPGDSRPVVDLAWFRVFDEDNPLEIIIQASAMQHEVALRDYYRLWSRSSGEEELDLVLVNDDPDAPNQLVERAFPDGQKWITRRAGFKVWQGFLGWVVTVNVACPAARFADNAQLLKSIAGSLVPAEPAEYRLAEHLRLVTRGQPVDFASYLPLSWKELPHRHDDDAPLRNVWLKKLRDQTTGTFSLVAAGKEQFSTSESFLAEAVSTWKAQCVDPQQLQFDPPTTTGSWKTVRGQQDVTIDQPGGPIEYRLELLLADTGTHWFHAEVFGPSPGNDFEAWAINRRALDLFTRQLRTA